MIDDIAVHFYLFGFFSLLFEPMIFFCNEMDFATIEVRSTHSLPGTMAWLK